MNSRELKELQQRLDNGVLPILMTPFAEDGQELMLAPMLDHLNWLLSKDADGCISAVLVAGANGEFYAMTDDERKQVIEAVVREANGRVPIVAGTPKPGTRLTIEMSKWAEDAGCQCVMVVNPYYCSPTGEGVFEYHSRVAKSIGIGYMIYNNNLSGNYFIPTDMLVELSSIENVVACKDVVGDVQQFFARSMSVGSHMAYVTSAGETMFAFITLLTGRKGFFSNIVNYAPEPVFGLCRAARAADTDGIEKAVRRLEPLLRYYEQFWPPWVDYRKGGGTQYLSVIKEGMRYRGFDAGVCRLPVTPLTPGQKRELHRVLDMLDLPRQ